MNHPLHSSWVGCWSSLGAQGDGLALMQKLVAAYAQPARKYHTLQHLTECLALMTAHRDLAIEPAEVGMSLWFHDSVYEVTAHDNEAKSAEWAVAELTAANVCPECIERIRQHILATRHDVLPDGRDQRLLIDIDLSILGAPPARFAEYEAQVREEYSWVPGPLFRQKRSEVLTQFLARPVIYSTHNVRQAFECQARENLAWSIERLNAGS